MYNDMPPLVEANPQPSIPPPSGATFLAGHPTPHNVQAGPWNANVSQPYPPFPTQSAAQEQWAGWSRYRQATPAPALQSMPSPYIPHAPFPDTLGGAQPEPIRRAVSLHTPNTQQQAPQWNTWGPSMLYNHARPPMYSFPTYPSMRPQTPASTISTPRSSSISTPRSSTSYVPPDWPGEPPKSWRRDFRFKSRLASLFRVRSAPRPIEESTDSARLCLAPVLQHVRSNPSAILDLRRDPRTLEFRALDRHIYAHDLMHPTTDPPTRFMRLYHTHLPWYIDVMPSGDGSYVTLGDFFTTICQVLALRICQADYYNDELDQEDRDALKQAWDERCRDEAERMDGVKRVDFLRGKYMFQGLTRGKNGIWQLRTGGDT